MSRETAARVLVHYFKTLFEKTGTRWDADNQVEIEGIVDDICDAAVAEAQAEAESRYGAGDWRNAR